MFKKSIFHNPTFWSGALIGCLMAVLTLASVNAYAQVAGDDPSAAASQDVVDEANSTSATQSGGPVGDAPGTQSSQDSTVNSPITASGVDNQAMFTSAPNYPLATSAAITSTFTYQGVLKDGDEPANGSYDFHFLLFDAPVAGTQLGEQFADAVSVLDGQFSAYLDFGPEAFAAQSVWLEIAVRSAGGLLYETLTPRQAITAAPLALSLPNVSTNPETGYVSVGGGAPISSYQVFGIHEPIEDWVGMYISGGGDSARPFYGYTTDDEGSYKYAWTEYNGGANEWQLHTNQGNVFSVNDAGDVRQPVASDGLVKAAAYVECWPDEAFLTVYSSFNNVTGSPVTAAVGPGVGQCYIDFGFNLTGRFYDATAVQPGATRAVTCDVDGGNPNRLHCMRWRPIDAGAEGWGGRIMVTIY